MNTAELCKSFEKYYMMRFGGDKKILGYSVIGDSTIVCASETSGGGFAAKYDLFIYTYLASQASFTLLHDYAFTGLNRTDDLDQLLKNYQFLLERVSRAINETVTAHSFIAPKFDPFGSTTNVVDYMQLGRRTTDGCMHADQAS